MLSVRSSRRAAGDVSVSAMAVTMLEEEEGAVEVALDRELMATQEPGSSLAWYDCQLDFILKAEPTRSTTGGRPGHRQRRWGTRGVVNVIDDGGEEEAGTT